MLSKELFKNKIQELLYLFPNWHIDCENPDVMKTWYAYFENLSNEDFEYLVKDYVKEEHTNPTVAGLLRHRDGAGQEGYAMK